MHKRKKNCLKGLKTKSFYAAGWSVNKLTFIKRSVWTVHSDLCPCLFKSLQGVCGRVRACGDREPLNRAAGKGDVLTCVESSCLLVSPVFLELQLVWRRDGEEPRPFALYVKRVAVPTRLRLRAKSTDAQNVFLWDCLCDVFTCFCVAVTNFGMGI